MKSQGSHAHMTSGRYLARNSLWNLAGQLLPMAVAIFAIPPIVRGLGVDRFGVLSLAWIVIGYFGLFDLGIGRALTKLVADKLGAREEQSIPALAWAALLLLLGLGLLGGLVTLALSRWLVYDALKVPGALQPETLRSFYLMALGIPIVTVTSGLRGVLEALQRFRILNLIRIPMSVFSFVGALLVLPFSHSLVPVIAVLIAGRLIGAAAHLAACFHALPLLRRRLVLDSSVLFPAVRFGGWMTVSNIVGPVMTYVDRFLIGALLTVSALAYYTAPFDMITRLLVIPGALAGVLFPAFAVSLQQGGERAGLLLSRGVKYVILAVFPIVLVVASFAPEGLRLWLGATFAENGSGVLRWLAAGVFINSVAQVPFALIQSAGRPDITAKFHLGELPVYLGAVCWLTLRFGIEGAAIAWAGRVTVDCLLLCIYAQRLLPRKSDLLVKTGAAMGAGVLLLMAASFPQGLGTRFGLTALGLLGFGLVGWLWALTLEERALVLAGPVRAYNALHRVLAPSHGLDASSPEAKEIREWAAARGGVDIIDHLATVFLETVAVRPRLIVELGVRQGVSRFAFEKAASAVGSSLVSVDIEDCSSTCRPGPGWYFVRGDDVQFARTFREWCAQRGLEPVIDVLFIDTSHVYEHTVEEIRSWFPYLAPHCKVIFHDTNLRRFYRRRDGTIGIGWDNKRGVIQAIETYLGTRFDERKDFATTLDGWAIRHWAHCNGLTILGRDSASPPRGAPAGQGAP